MHLVVRARRLLARHPSIYWVMCAGLAGASGLIVHAQLAALDDARHAWGTTRTVLVATVDLQPGDALHARATALPSAMVPASAIAEAASTATARHRIAVGEVIVADDLVSAGGPAARASQGERVVGLTDALARNIAVGSDVEVTADGVVLADHARVVDVADDVIFVAVSPSDAPAVCAAAHDGSAGLIFVP
jgi:hypothetical protein